MLNLNGMHGLVAATRIIDQNTNYSKNMLYCFIGYSREPQKKINITDMSLSIKDQHLKIFVGSLVSFYYNPAFFLPFIFQKQRQNEKNFGLEMRVFFKIGNIFATKHYVIDCFRHNGFFWIFLIKILYIPAKFQIKHFNSGLCIHLFSYPLLSIWAQMYLSSDSFPCQRVWFLFQVIVSCLA